MSLFWYISVHKLRRPPRKETFYFLYSHSSFVSLMHGPFSNKAIFYNSLQFTSYIHHNRYYSCLRGHKASIKLIDLMEKTVQLNCLRRALDWNINNGHIYIFLIPNTDHIFFSLSSLNGSFVKLIIICFHWFPLSKRVRFRMAIYSIDRQIDFVWVSFQMRIRPIGRSKWV